MPILLPHTKLNSLMTRNIQTLQNGLMLTAQGIPSIEPARGRRFLSIDIDFEKSQELSKWLNGFHIPFSLATPD
jgi:hypothetical protein